MTVFCLQRQIISHCTTDKMGRLGFEPRTNRLKAEYSTVELATLEIHSFRLFLTDSDHNIPFRQKS